MGRTPQEKVRIEYRRTQVTDLHLAGWTQVTIARELGVTQGTISTDMKANRKEWKASRIRNMDEVRDEAIKGQQLILRESLKAYEQSQQAVETTRITQQNDQRKVEKTIRQRSGDPRFLKIAQEAITECRKLQELDAAASTVAADSDEKPSLQFWEWLYSMSGDHSKDPDYMDPIERKIAEVGRSGSDASGNLETFDQGCGTGG